MATIVTRAGKGSALSWTEGDANITNLNNDKIELTDLSITTNTSSGNGSLSYNNTTGVFSFTPADLGSVGGLADIVEDTSPQLGGDLDVNGKNITSASNGNINITPNGSGNISLAPASGKIILGALDFPTSMGTTGQVLTTNGSSAMSWTTVSASPSGSNTELQFNNSGAFGSSSALTWDGTYLSGTYLKSSNSSGDEGGEILLAKPATNSTLGGTGVTIDVYQNKLRIFEQGGSARGAYIDLTAAATGVGTNLLSGSGVTTLDGLSDVVITAAATNDALIFDGTNWVDTALSSVTVGTASVASTVTLTSDNSTNATNYITFVNASTGNEDLRTDTGLHYNPSTGRITAADGYFTTLAAGTISLAGAQDSIAGLAYAATISPDASSATVRTITLTGNVTFNAFTNPISGQSLTLIITQDATGSRTLSSTMKFAGGSKTLSTAANAIDILTVSYIGTTYYASLAKGFA